MVGILSGPTPSSVRVKLDLVVAAVAVAAVAAAAAAVVVVAAASMHVVEGSFAGAGFGSVYLQASAVCWECSAPELVVEVSVHQTEQAHHSSEVDFVVQGAPDHSAVPAYCAYF